MPSDALPAMECEEDEFADFNLAQDLDGQANDDFDFEGFKPASNVQPRDVIMDPYMNATSAISFEMTKSFIHTNGQSLWA